jgi:cytochrome c-type biogenesis protein CcmF
LTLLFGAWMDMQAWQYWVLLFASFYTVSANLDYMIRLSKLNPRAVASSLSHVGFGIMVIGSLASGLNKFHISSNPFAQRGLLSEERLAKNVMLFKNMPMFMSGYKVTYADDYFEGNNRIYDIKFEQLDSMGQPVDSFTLHPTALYNNTVTKVAAFNPSTLHTLSKDIFTYIASIPQIEADVEIARQREDSLDYAAINLMEDKTAFFRDTVIVGDSTVIRSYELNLVEVLDEPTHSDYTAQEGEISFTPKISVFDTYYDSTYTVEPTVTIRGQAVYSYNVHLQDLSLKFKVKEDALRYAIIMEEDLDYKTYEFGMGQELDLEGHSIKFTGFVPNPESVDYTPEEGDEALWARFLIDGKKEVKPIVCIRGNNFLTFKSIDKSNGLHLKPLRINLTEGGKDATLLMSIAKEAKIEKMVIPVGVAHAPRTDFVVLESIVFPGINLFWIGSIVMLIGLFIGVWNHRLRKQVT